MVVKIELEVRMAVKIVRVLNTNAVVSSDQEGRELIITGAGIGFKKKKGENLDEALADKTYYLESVDDSRRLQEVVKEISEEYLEIVSRIVIVFQIQYTLPSPEMATDSFLIFFF